VAAIGHRKQRAAVRTAVLERIQLAVDVAGDKDGLLADEGRAEVSRL
jgi:hypothetical protein